MKAKEFRDLSVEELKTKTADLRRDLFDHQFFFLEKQLDQEVLK